MASPPAAGLQHAARQAGILGVVPAMAAYDEEIFGPVAAITTFDTDDEAVRLANDTEFGMYAAVIYGAAELPLSEVDRSPSGFQKSAPNGIPIQIQIGARSG